MIIDIDDPKSVQAAMEGIARDWFDPAGLYAGLKVGGKTDSSGFWAIPTRMLADVSEFLGWTSEKFLGEWDKRCFENDTKFMGYHCTRHSDMGVFLEKGILPLSGETVKLTNNEGQKTEERGVLQYRLRQTPGPWFLLGYRCAKKPDNHFRLKGPEILLGCDGYHVGVEPAKSIPLIIHCAIPYSLLSETGYFAFCALRAYFSFLDPEDGSDDFFDGYSIDLQGKTLDPGHIVKVEET